MPSVSIIVPVYNSGEYLKECMDSIACQSFKDFEVLMIDDGSTDSSPILMDEMIKIDNRFKAIHKKNGGVSSARNVGLSMAQGEFVTMIDSDDIIDRNYLEALYKTCIEKNVDVAICNNIRMFNSGGNIDRIAETISDDRIVSGEEVLDTFDNSRRVAYYAVGKMFLRKTLGELRYPLDIRLCEDDVFNVRFYSLPGISAAFCSRAEYGYRIHGSSLTRSVTPKVAAGKVNAYRQILEIADKYQGSLFQHGARRDYVQSLFSYLLRIYKSKEESVYDVKSIATKTLRCDSEFGGILPTYGRMICKMTLISPSIAMFFYLSLSHLKHIVDKG